MHVCFIHFTGDTESSKEGHDWCQAGGESEVRTTLNHRKIVFLFGLLSSRLTCSLCVSSQYPGILLRPDEGREALRPHVML